MMRVLKWLLAALVVVFAAMQFFGPAKTNPPVDEAKAIQTNAQMSTEISAIITRACFDCHSHQTQWPWYSSVAPVSWFVINHVNDGRKHLNFSEWGTYNAKRQHNKLEEIGEQVERGEMPLKSYLPLHPDAKLTPEDVDRITAWVAAERQRVAEVHNLVDNP